MCAPFFRSEKGFLPSKYGMAAFSASPSFGNSDSAPNCFLSGSFSTPTCANLSAFSVS